MDVCLSIGESFAGCGSSGGVVCRVREYELPKSRRDPFASER